METYPKVIIDAAGKTWFKSVCNCGNHPNGYFKTEKEPNSCQEKANSKFIKSEI